MTLPLLNINRNQLAQFLPDHETIRQFENLFSIADSVQNNPVEDALIIAGNADAKANTALKSIYWGRSGANLFPKNLSDSVGIGTASPTAQLDVANDVIFNSSFGTYDFTANKDTVGKWLFYDSSADSIDLDGSTITLTAPANTSTLSAQPTGTVDLAIATTKYVDDSSLWQRSGTTVSTKTPGDSLSLGGGIINAPTRVTTTYAILTTDYVVFCNTDSAGFTATLPAGVEGQTYRIVNTGTSGNILEVAPTGAENLTGENSNFSLEDGESLILCYNSTDGWY